MGTKLKRAGSLVDQLEGTRPTNPVFCILGGTPLKSEAARRPTQQKHFDLEGVIDCQPESLQWRQKATYAASRPLRCETRVVDSEKRPETPAESVGSEREAEGFGKASEGEGDDLVKDGGGSGNRRQLSRLSSCVSARQKAATITKNNGGMESEDRIRKSSTTFRQSGSTISIGSWLECQTNPNAKVEKFESYAYMRILRSEENEDVNEDINLQTTPQRYFVIDRLSKTFKTTLFSTAVQTPQYIVALLQFLDFKWVGIRFKSPSAEANTRLAFTHALLRTEERPHEAVLALCNTKTKVVWACVAVSEEFQPSDIAAYALGNQDESAEIPFATSDDEGSESSALERPEPSQKWAPAPYPVPWLDMSLSVPRSCRYMQYSAGMRQFDKQVMQDAPLNSASTRTFSRLSSTLSGLREDGGERRSLRSRLLWDSVKSDLKNAMNSTKDELKFQWMRFLYGTKSAERRLSKEKLSFRTPTGLLRSSTNWTEVCDLETTTGMDTWADCPDGDSSNDAPASATDAASSHIVENRSAQIDLIRKRTSQLLQRTHSGSNPIAKIPTAEEARAAWGGTRTFSGACQEDMGEFWISQANLAYAPKTHRKMVRRATSEMTVLDVS